MDETLVIEQVIARLQTLEEGKYISTAMHTGTMCDASAFVCYCHNDTALLLNGWTQLFQVASDFT